MQTNLSIVIVTYRTPVTLVERCLDSVHAAADRADVSYEVILVENGTYAWEFEGRPVKVVQLGSNLGFGVAANAGLTSALGEFVFFLNPDAVLSPDSVKELLNRAGAEGDRLVNGWLEKSDGVQVDAYMMWFFSLGRLMKRRRYRQYLEESRSLPAVPVEKVSGGALIGRRALLAELGPFDPSFFLYGEDVDLSIRAAAAGVALEAVPSAGVSHAGAASSVGVSKIVERSRADAALRVLRKHKGVVPAAWGGVELAVITSLGVLRVKNTSSSGRSARLARLAEIRRWRFGVGMPERFSPTFVSQRGH